tara:strand:- start:3178 stop:3450 length:273 start_codon:yes stop_codon:yes gene_type:complete
MRAFWDLNTERSSGGNTLGPIPWSKARLYGREELGLYPELLGLFWTMVSALDTAFLGWQKNEHDRYSRQQKTATKKGPGGRETTQQTYGR